MNWTPGPYARLKGKPVRPHPVQAAFHASPAPYKYFRGGIGSGKSLAGAWELVSNVLENREYLYNTGQRGPTLYLAAAPLKKLVDAGSRTHVDNILEEARIASGFDLVERRREGPPAEIYLITGDKIGFHTLKDPKMFAGFNAAGVWYDESELADNPDEGWIALTSRLRDERFPPERLRAIVTSSPRGYRGLSAMFETQAAQGDPRYAIFTARNRDNPAMTDEYRAMIATRMSERERRQQLDGELEAEQGAVYGLEYDPARSLVYAPEWEWRGAPRADRQYFVSMDWGGSYHALFIEHNPYLPGTSRPDKLGGEDVVFHELTMDDVQVEDFLNEVKRHLAMLKLPIETTDAYADYNPREAVYIANKRGYFDGRCVASRVGPDGDKERGIAVVRWRLAPAGGEHRRLRFAERLRRTKSDRPILRCLSNYKRIERDIDGVTVRLGVNQDSPWSHGPDALRAYCWPRYRHLRIELDAQPAA